MKTLFILLIVFFIILFLYIAFGLFVVFIANRKLFSKRGEDPDNICYLTYDDFPELEREEYSAILRKATLRGYIYSRKDKNEYKGLIILSHGFFGTHVQYLIDIDYLTKLGYRVLAFDNFGVGLSSGENQGSFVFSYYSLRAVLEDVERRELNEDLPIYLYGHSMGGYAISLTLRYHPEVKKAIVRSAPLSAGIAGRDLLHLQNKFLYYFLYPIIPLCFSLLGTKRENSSSYREIKKSRETAVLLIHSKNDNLVPYKHSLARKVEHLKRDNFEIFVTEGGLHNSFVTEESSNNYSKLKEEYKKLVKEGDNKKLDQFALKLKRDKRNYYQISSDVKEKITEFLEK